MDKFWFAASFATFDNALLYMSVMSFLVVEKNANSSTIPWFTGIVKLLQSVNFNTFWYKFSEQKKHIKASLKVHLNISS